MEAVSVTVPELAIITNELRHVIIKDKPGNTYKYAKQTGNWISLKGPFDVYITLAYEAYPLIRVLLTVDETTRRAQLLKNCVLENDIQIENNAKRRKDLFFKEYTYTDKATLEQNIKDDFLVLLKNVTDELKQRPMITT